MSMSEISPQEVKKAFKVPVLGGILRAVISLIGFYHILKEDSIGLAIQLNNLSIEKNNHRLTNGKAK